MITGFQSDFVLADKGCDANELIETIQSTGAVAVIPPRKNRIESRAYDKIIPDYPHCSSTSILYI